MVFNITLIINITINLVKINNVNIFTSKILNHNLDRNFIFLIFPSFETFNAKN